MKIELEQLKYSKLKDLRFLFVYGNLPELADVLYVEFLRYLEENSIAALGTCISCGELVKNAGSQQEDLFNTALRVFRVAAVQDNNVDSFLKMVDDDHSSIYIITPGDYKKSKCVSDTLAKRAGWLSLPSFKNKLTYNAICRFFVRDVSLSDVGTMVGILEKSEESLSSVIVKLALLYESDKFAVQHFYINSNSWVFDMQPIALLRFIANMCLKGCTDKLSEVLYGKLVKINENAVLEYCLRTEVRVKTGIDVSNDMILNDILIGNVL